ncbi:MAG: hypothetical protein OIF48_06430 [Silicimonas sp.]|nr:hypothetical protein [Silicimonas sp.]
MRAVLKRLWGARRALLFYGLLLVLGTLAGENLMSFAVPEMRPMNEPAIHRIVMMALVVFVVAAALPFVPGAEIGLALLLVFGGDAALLVYGGMVGALVLAYGVARLVPVRAVVRLAGWLRLERAARLAARLEASDGAELSLPGWGGRILRNRYLVLAALINLPGNSVLGGGGGIAFAAGISGLYRFWAYLATVLLAVAPVPLFFWLVR